MSLSIKTMKAPKIVSQTKAENFEESEGESSEMESDSGDLAEDDSQPENLFNDDKSSDSGGEQEESKFVNNPGWANAMQKILKTNKPKKKKTLVLSRAKKISEVKLKKEEIPFEIEGKDGAIKVELMEKKPSICLKTDKPEKKKEKETLKHSIRVKPSPLNRPREKILQRIATKGVVQLFNAVREQQQEIEKKLIEAGPLEGKKEKVLKSIDKRGFLDLLMGGTTSTTVDQEIDSKKDNITETANKVWSVLRDDFAMGANLKDWDKNTPEEEEESSAPEEMDSD